MNIIDFYRALLADVSVRDINSDGFLSAIHGDQVFDLEVDGKRLVLPTQEILRGGNWDKRVAFHPLSENINRGESPVLKALKDYIWLRINTTLGALLRSLMETACTPETHKKLGGPKVAAYLKNLGDVDDKTFAALEKVGKTITKNPNRRLVSIYLKHGSKGGEGFARQAVVSFPIFDDLNAEGDTVFDVKMRPKDKQAIKNLLEYILGDAETRELYSYGSKNLEAPYFHALLNSFYKLATRLNSIVKVHEKHLGCGDELKFDLGWAEQLDNFALYRGVIPVQSGNEGELLNKDGEPKVGLQEQAQQIFNRKSEERPVDVPWTEERRVEDRRHEERRGPDRRQEEPHPGGSIGMDKFRQQFEKPARRDPFDDRRDRNSFRDMERHDERRPNTRWGDQGRNSFRSERSDRGGRGYL